MFNWSANILQGVFNGVATATTTYSSGGGNTSETNSSLFTIGAINASSQRFPGVISSVQAFRAVLTTAQLEAFRNLEKKYNGGLP